MFVSVGGPRSPFGGVVIQIVKDWLLVSLGVGKQCIPDQVSGDHRRK